MRTNKRLRCLSAQLEKNGLTRLVRWLRGMSISIGTPETLQKPYEIASLSSFCRECKAGEPSAEEEQRDTEQVQAEMASSTMTASSSAVRSFTGLRPQARPIAAKVQALSSHNMRGDMQIL